MFDHSPGIVIETHTGNCPLGKIYSQRPAKQCQATLKNKYNFQKQQIGILRQEQYVLLMSLNFKVLNFEF